MQTIILAGGIGTRLIEETELKPKPMVEIGEKPLLWHIMKHYAHFGFNDFIVAMGYKGEVIKNFFLNYLSMNSDIKIDLKTGAVEKGNGKAEDWRVRLVDTGLGSLTGTRIKKLARLIGGERFMLTYGDGLSDVDLQKLVAFHEAHGKLATLTAVNPPERFGHLELENDRVSLFAEKVNHGDQWINGGYFVLEPEIFDYIDPDRNIKWEEDPLRALARDGQLMAYRHTSFWQCMDTYNEKKMLDDMWQSGKPPWKIWT